jgi:hypothetical protein
MEKLLSTYSLYETLGFLFPGMLIVGEITFLLVSLDKANFSSFSKYGISFGIFFVLASYLVGHLIQAAANYMEKLVFKIKSIEPPTRDILGGKSDLFSDPLKKKIREAAQDYFNLPSTVSEKDIYKLCYSLILSKGLGARAETMNALYGFYRGMTAASLLSLAIFLVLLFFYYNTSWFVVYLLIFLCFLVATSLFFNRFRRFSLRFADYVYRDFYVFYCSDKKEGI